MLFRRMITSLTVATCALSMAACASRSDSSDQDRGFLGVFGSGGGSVSDASEAGIGVNSFLWRSSLEVLSFMPLSEVDPFGGVIITDDMEMGAITEHYGFKDAIIRAVNAGNDILLYSNTVKPSLDLPNKILDVLEAEAARDPSFKKRIKESYQRIMRMKQRLGN